MKKVDLFSCTFFVLLSKGSHAVFERSHRLQVKLFSFTVKTIKVLTSVLVSNPEMDLPRRNNNKDHAAASSSSSSFAREQQPTKKESASRDSKKKKVPPAATKLREGRWKTK